MAPNSPKCLRNDQAPRLPCLQLLVGVLGCGWESLDASVEPRKPENELLRMIRREVGDRFLRRDEEEGDGRQGGTGASRSLAAAL